MDNANGSSSSTSMGGSSSKATWMWIIGMVVVAVVFFFGGMKYGETKTKVPATGVASTYGAGGAGRRAGGGFGAGGTTPVIGTIMSNSNGIYTVSIASGGSKNVLVGSSTTIAKSTAGTAADLANGTSVIVTGTTDSSGNVDATNIQIRSAGMTGGFGGGAGAGTGSPTPTATK